ncbi:recombinase family protein [Porcipelethomonas ammoniilytica]|uniref:recombinase family protein n=1 Tax=Eubacteriales TaxID=186802 RepID=UPI000822D2B0|nr:MULTISPECIES: recombinase family protein [Eubacteriales]MCU6720496.1 recombinase family protein [Porcipelethomonas ammoniilytica]MDB2108652.1 recombinase [Clostridium paraputrificum]SCJ15313.1 Uncharacterised protein [uncultured Ruminococcus sp.]
MKHTPFGYKVVDGKAVIDEVAAGQLREMYKGFLEGKSLVVAARDVGIETYHGTVTRMLGNKKYLGTDYYPQIIDQETFDKALEEKQRRKDVLGRNNRQKPKEEKSLPTTFHFKPAELSYTDPFEQAKYIYSLIESEE